MLSDFIVYHVREARVMLATPAKWKNSVRHFLRSHRAHVALKSRSRCAHVALTSRSNTSKNGERILDAHTALVPRSPRAQMGKNCAQMGKIALLARHERIMIALFFKLKIRIFERDVSAV